MTMNLLYALKRFYRDEKGVYVVMTALLAFPLLFLIAFTVDGSGILLDRARLAQATEQAALLLTTENNQHRADKSNLSNVRVTDEEVRNAKGSFRTEKERKESAQALKRNQELVQGMVKLYLRSYDKNQKSSSPITIPKDFIAECRSQTNTRTNGESGSVACLVQGDIERKFWLPWSYTLTGNNSNTVDINSGKSYAIKEKDILAPIDLMLVNDISYSMDNPPSDKTKTKKIDSLKKVVGDIANILIPDEPPKNISPYNRIGIASFGLGAQQAGKTDTTQIKKCVLPYYGSDKQVDIKVWRDRGGKGNTYDKLKNKVKLYADSSYRRAYDPYQQGTYMYIRDSAVKLANLFLEDFIDNTMFLDKSKTHGNDPFVDVFNKYFDINTTLNKIKDFKGEDIRYDINFNKSTFCFSNNRNSTVTDIWFNQKDASKLTSVMRGIQPGGWTLASSGLLVGTNLMVNTNKEALPSKIRTNTQRIILVLSDGVDTALPDLTGKLLNAGMCLKIREKLDSLQDKAYRQLPAKIAFVVFGYRQKPEDKASWENCVGKGNYFVVDDEDQLLKAFKQIIGFEEEVGRSSSVTPGLFK